MLISLSNSNTTEKIPSTSKFLPKDKISSTSNINPITYIWATTNSNTYMCTNKSISIPSGVINSNVVCAQANYPTKVESNNNLDNSGTIYCPEGTTIQCLLYATYGITEGSCSGTPFKDDPVKEWVYLPEAVATQMIGHNSFTFVLDKDMTINGVTIVDPTVASLSSKILNVLAYCSNGVTTGTTNTGPNASNFIKMGTPVLAFLIMILL